MAKRYTPDEKERGMTMVILNHGNHAAAARDLEAAGTPVPKETLTYWSKTYTDDMERISRELAPRMQAERLRSLETVVARATEIELEGLEFMRGKMKDLDLRDIPGAIRNISTVKGVSVDKIQKAEELNKERSPIRPIEVSINLLQRRGILEVEGETIEIPAEAES